MSFTLSQVLEFRDENRARYEANRAQEAALIKAERDYWNAAFASAATQEERDRALDELEALRILETAT